MNTAKKLWLFILIFDGDCFIALANCENVETGKVISWPPRPLTVRGSFAGLSNPKPSA